jgi:hypothetical protein
LARLVADDLGVDTAADPRPRLVVAALFGALNAAWAAYPARTISAGWPT